MESVSKNVRVVFKLDGSVQCSSCGHQTDIYIDGREDEQSFMCDRCSSDINSQIVAEWIRDSLSEIDDVTVKLNKNRSISVNTKNDLSFMIWNTGVIGITGDVNVDQSIRVVNDILTRISESFTDPVLDYQVTNQVFSHRVGSSVDLNQLYSSLATNEMFDNVTHSSYGVIKLQFEVEDVSIDLFSSGELLLRHHSKSKVNTIVDNIVDNITTLEA